MFKTAAGDPCTLAVAVDASAARLYDGFRRASKARLENALFAVANAESMPPELAGVADEVRVQFPWGSLLDGVLAADPAIVDGLASLLAPRGTLTILLSVVEKDGVPGVRRLDQDAARAVADRIATAACADVAVRSCRLAVAGDVAASHSTWAKRLGVGRSRDAWVLVLRRR